MAKSTATVLGVIMWMAFLCQADATRGLRFDAEKGEFRVLQVADMHYADGKKTACMDVFPSQMPTCSDLNTTAFVRRLIREVKPHFIVFTGDNIFGWDATDAAKSMDAAFAPAVESNIPWAAVIGNHDQESTLSREGVMKHIVGMKNTLSKFNPSDDIDGYGNYNLEVRGAEGSILANKSVLNLYFLDSGDYTDIMAAAGYDWIKPSQLVWFHRTSLRLQRQYMKMPVQQNAPAPALAYFHIPLPEYAISNFTGVKLDTGVSSASVNSGFFSAMMTTGDVKAVFVGHDHLNDYCGKLMNINLCYAGGFGYHAYGKAGWARRARMMVASLKKTKDGSWGDVESIKTWKYLDDKRLTVIDKEELWRKDSR